MKYSNDTQTIRVVGDTGYTVIKAARPARTLRWEAPNGVTLEELKEAIAFLDANPLPNEYETKVKKAPIGTRAEGIDGNTAFFFKVATDKWYFYSSIDLKNPYTLVDGNTATYTDNALATIYAVAYPIQENA